MKVYIAGSLFNEAENAQRKKEGKLILLASHNREDIDILCDEVYEMEMGELKRIKNK